jgi:hypothetical protein
LVRIGGRLIQALPALLLLGLCATRSFFAMGWIHAVAVKFSNRSLLISLFSFLLGSLLTTSAAAVNIIRLDPANALTDVGHDVSFDLIMDFDSNIQGGGVEITYDATKLQFQSFIFDPLLTDDAFFRCSPATVTPNCNELFPPTIEIGWGVLFSPSLTGTRTIGSFIFTAIASGSSLVSLAPSLGFPGPFFDLEGNAIDTNLEGSSISIGLVALPEPSTGLLFAFGLFGIGLDRKQIRAGRTLARPLVKS